MNRYISKSLHNKQEYYWATIYRAGADVVSTITSIKEDDKGNCCDYQDDWDDWSGWDNQDHEIVMVTLVTRMTRVGGWDKVNVSMTGIHRMIGMTGIPVVT